MRGLVKGGIKKLRMGILRTLVAIVVMTIISCPVPARTQDKEVTIAISQASIPYNIPDLQSGIEFEIVKEALAVKGYRMIPRYVTPLQRNMELLKRRVDGVMTISALSRIEAFYSDVHIIHENIAVSLPKNNLTISTMNDLKSLAVVAFQGASTYLGDEFAAMAEANPRYQEIANPEAQVSMLFSGLADVIVIERKIFQFYLRHYNYKNRIRLIKTSQGISVHELFDPIPYRVGFVDRTVRDDFNEGLEELRRTGRYDRIILKYTDR